MHLIVGLGNPGAKYLQTRHNIGFMLIDALAYAFSSPPFKSEHKALIGEIRIGSKKALILKPQTYMNLSGESVQAAAHYYKINSKNILVAHDEVDLGFGSIKFQKNKGHGGHNGIRNIHQILGTKEYMRLRMGVSRPSNSKMDVADYVLQNFSNDELKQIPDILNNSCDAVECFIGEGAEAAGNKFNSKEVK